MIRIKMRSRLLHNGPVARKWKQFRISLKSMKNFPFRLKWKHSKHNRWLNSSYSELQKQNLIIAAINNTHAVPVPQKCAQRAGGICYWNLNHSTLIMVLIKLYIFVRRNKQMNEDAKTFTFTNVLIIQRIETKRRPARF